MAKDRPNALAAGIVSANLVLPGSIEGRQRLVRISLERIRHIAERRPEALVFCLTYMGRVLSSPEYLGYREGIDPRSVEFVRRAGRSGWLLVVVVKFLDDLEEAWVTTSHRLSDDNLTRRIRNGTMRIVEREP